MTSNPTDRAQVLKTRSNDYRVNVDEGTYVLFSDTPEEDLKNGQMLVRCISPVDGEFIVPPHWHPKTTEYFTVFVGTVYVTLEGVEHTLTPESGELRIPPYAVHSIRVPKGIHAEFAERADPDPTRKMGFLRTLLGRNGQPEPLSFIQSMRLFYEDGDSFPSTGLRPMDHFMVLLGGLASVIGIGGLPRDSRKSI